MGIIESANKLWKSNAVGTCKDTQTDNGQELKKGSLGSNASARYLNLRVALTAVLIQFEN